MNLICKAVITLLVMRRSLGLLKMRRVEKLTGFKEQIRLLTHHWKTALGVLFYFYNSY